jgi:hypothetical protein
MRYEPIDLAALTAFFEKIDRKESLKPGLRVSLSAGIRGVRGIYMNFLLGRRWMFQMFLPQIMCFCWTLLCISPLPASVSGGNESSTTFWAVEIIVQ